MVHGGGHHHRHQQQPRAGGAGGGPAATAAGRGAAYSGGWGRPANVIFVQQPPNPWWVHMAATYPYRNQYQNRDPAVPYRHLAPRQGGGGGGGGGGCRRCCERFWCCVVPCFFCCCCRRPWCDWCGSSFETNAATSRAQEEQQQQQQQRKPIHRQSYPSQMGATERSPHCGSFFPAWIVSLVLLLLLIFVPTIRESRFDMNAGETRRVRPRFLSKDVTISGVGSGPGPPFARVYSLAECPPLGGPPATAENRMDLTLAVDDFQYDSFYLNGGSTIRVRLDQSRGSTNVYLLRGSHALRRVQDNDESDYYNLRWRSHAVLSRFATAGAGPVQLNYVVPESDVYIVVYDNASASTGALSLEYAVTMATYDLRGQVPCCQAPTAASPCTVPVAGRAGCLLVQAASGSDDAGDASLASGSSSGDAVVTVQVGSHRNWAGLVSLSLLPIALQLLYSSLLYFSSSRRSPEEERPPPFNPEQGFRDYGAVASDLPPRPVPSAPPPTDDGAMLPRHSCAPPAEGAPAPAAAPPLVEATVLLPLLEEDDPPVAVAVVPAENVFPVAAPPTTTDPVLGKR